MNPQDLYRLRTAGALDVTGDGTVVYALSWPDEDSDSNRAVLRIRDEAGDRPLTTHHQAASPVISPDGRWVAYTASARSGEPAQLWLAPLAAGGPVQVSDRPDGVVGRPAWAPDSASVVVSAPVRPADQVDLDEKALATRVRRITDEEYRFNGRGWTHDRRRHLFRFPVPALDAAPTAAAAGTQLTDGPWDDESPAVTADGARVLFLSGRHADRSLTGGNDVWSVPLDGGDTSQVTTQEGQWSDLVTGPDASAAVVVGALGRNVVRPSPAHRLDLSTGTVTVLGDPQTSVAAAVPTKDAVLVATVRRGRVGIDRAGLDPGAAPSVVLDEACVVHDLAVDDAGRVFFTAGRATRPAELYLLDPAQGASAERLTGWNDAFCAEVDLAEPQEVQVPSADGYPVHAFVVRPPASAPTADGARPGLLYIHGGPHAQYSLDFFDEFQLAAARGYVVMAGNPRGSDGYGAEHGSVIVGAMGEKDWDDVRSLADHLAGLQDVDAGRLGIGGGSYGGFMTTWAIGHDQRFAAALVERCVISWESFQGTSDIGAHFVRRYTGATTQDDPDALRRQSPLTYAGQIRTPTLIVHSEEDWRCPPEQAEQLFTVLRYHGVASELVRFPGGNHELSRSGRPSHRVQRFDIVHEWFDRYLG